MERWKNCVAVVTGASAGIGFAIVKEFVKAGIIVVALARRKERLDELRSTLPGNQQGLMHTIRCDVSSLESVNAAFDWIEKNLGGVDIMINNAGVLKFGQLVLQDPKEASNVLQTNIMSVVHCTQRAFRSMKERNVAGHVVIVGSIAGHMVPFCPPNKKPVLNIYPSSKYALTAMTETFRQEFRAFGTNIKVTNISPSLVDTELLAAEFDGLSKLKAEDIASAVVYTVSTPPHMQVHDIIIRPMNDCI